MRISCCCSYKHVFALLYTCVRYANVVLYVWLGFGSDSIYDCDCKLNPYFVVVVVVVVVVYAYARQTTTIRDSNGRDMRGRQ